MNGLIFKVGGTVDEEVTGIVSLLMISRGDVLPLTLFDSASFDLDSEFSFASSSSLPDSAPGLAEGALLAVSENVS